MATREAMRVCGREREERMARIVEEIAWKSW